MGRNLNDDQVTLFRERLCEVAARLFAKHGPDAVSMRQLADELGVSPMTPYRYFHNKDDILAAVRTKGYDEFAAALEKGRLNARDATEVGCSVFEAYVDFAFADPHTYKLIFDFTQPTRRNYPELLAAQRRARDTMTSWVNDEIEAGLIVGNAKEIGRIVWASVHGLIGLELAGKLPRGSARSLKDTALRMIETACRPHLKGCSLTQPSKRSYAR